MSINKKYNISFKGKMSPYLNNNYFVQLSRETCFTKISMAKQKLVFCESNDSLLRHWRPTEAGKLCNGFRQNGRDLTKF